MLKGGRWLGSRSQPGGQWKGREVSRLREGWMPEEASVCAIPQYISQATVPQSVTHSVVL